jgi:hypothetical protein
LAAALAQEPSRPPARAGWSLVPDFRDALGQVQDAGTIIVTGSFHTVGDVMRRSWDWRDQKQQTENWKLERAEFRGMAPFSLKFQICICQVCCSAEALRFD